MKHSDFRSVRISALGKAVVLSLYFFIDLSYSWWPAGGRELFSFLFSFYFSRSPFFIKFTFCIHFLNFFSPAQIPVSTKTHTCEETVNISNPRTRQVKTHPHFRLCFFFIWASIFRLWSWGISLTSSQP